MGIVRNYSFVSISCSKSPVKVPKICNINSWIENDPLPWNFSENSSDLVPPSVPYQEPGNREDLQGPSQVHQEFFIMNSLLDCTSDPMRALSAAC